MNRVKIILLGVFSILPVLHYAHLIFFRKAYFEDFFYTDETFLFLMKVLLQVLVIIYIVHLVNNECAPKEDRTFWAVSILLLSSLAIPAYWFLFLWRSPKQLEDDEQPEECHVLQNEEVSEEQPLE